MARLLDLVSKWRLWPWDPEELSRRSLEAFVLDGFYANDVGSYYSVDRHKKAELVTAFRRITGELPSATGWMNLVVIAREILSLPPSAKGDIVECGCWSGASSACLSLVCSLAGRNLFICDSFKGLPEDDGNPVHVYPHLKVFGYYEEGMYASGLEEVRDNVARMGEISVCTFIPGYFSESLGALSDPIALAYLDVDLASSTRDCIRHIWPLLVDGGVIYTDDACDMEIVRVWFDEPWWEQELSNIPPGYVGSGSGLPLDPDYSSLGYARKVIDPQRSFGRVPWLRYSKTDSGSRPAD